MKAAKASSAGSAASSEGSRLARWEGALEWPLAILALAFLLAYAAEVLLNLRSPQDFWPDLIINCTWVLFGVDYLVRLWLAEEKRRWFARNVPDLLILALPFFRPLRLLRLVRMASILHRHAGSAFRGKVVSYVVASSLILIVIASLGVLDAEQNAAGSNIRSFGDALWWSITTITTVGYGDYYPVTLGGRLIAVGLMVSGIALLSSVTATFASWFIEQIRSEQRGR